MRSELYLLVDQKRKKSLVQFSGKYSLMNHCDAISLLHILTIHIKYLHYMFRNCLEVTIDSFSLSLNILRFFLMFFTAKLALACFSSFPPVLQRYSISNSIRAQSKISSHTEEQVTCLPIIENQVFTTFKVPLKWWYRLCELDGVTPPLIAVFSHCNSTSRQNPCFQNTAITMMRFRFPSRLRMPYTCATYYI